MKNISKTTANISQQIIIYGLGILILLMPFHAFFSIYLGSLGFDRVIVQSWKEVLALILSFAWLAYQLAKKKLAFKADAVNLFFISIVFVSILVTLFVRPNSEAVLFGVKTNLVAIAIFFIAQIPIPSKSFLKKNLLWIILVPGLIVSLLAVIQSFLIPPSLLEQIGYNVNTINPRQIIDGSIDFLRSFSTLGGPNQLGAYLLLPLAFSLAYGIKRRSWPILCSSILILAGITLSFSRSAWIGAIITFGLAVFISLEIKQKIIFALFSIVLLLSAVVGIGTQINTNVRLQNVLLHGRVFENRIEGSDSARLESISNTTKEIVKRPFGNGLGSAGPASFKAAKPIIPENWFLQISYEIGIVGLLLYILAFAALLGDFIRDRKNPLAVSLFSATIGILVINIFLQGLGDSTLVLITFALYGLYKSRNQ
jgi:hypothetical protein